MYKELLVRAKRSNIFGAVRGDQVLALRKFFNVTIRRRGEADFSVERTSRIYMSLPKELFFFTGEERAVGLEPHEEYMKTYTQVARDFWRVLRPALVKIQRGNTLEKYWGERAVHAPAGSSTIVKTVDRSSWDERLTKRVTVEMLDDDFLINVLNSAPMNRATHFVKPEPGKKLRALYASFDEEMFMSVYASDKLENSMYHIRGVMIRQTPADVVAWMAESANGLGTAQLPTAYWMSTDYSDYNSEHTFAEMAVLDATHAEMWERETGGGAAADMAADRAATAKWISQGFCDSWICWGLISTTGFEIVRVSDSGVSEYVITDGDRYSIAFKTSEEAEFNLGRKIKLWSCTFNGLYAGSRDTARNNTMIHAVDMHACC